MPQKHEIYMRRCFDLAKKGRPQVRLNPLVGSVIVYQDRIIGEGYHMKYGGPHAEIEALQSVTKENQKYLAESTLYVNLAPCNHQGKTPPCSQAIIDAGIPKVVIAMTDINQVADGGVQRLRQAGVHVVEDVLKNEASELNLAFLRGLHQLRPYVTLKWAESYDGFIGQENRRIPISGEQSKLKVHDMRSQHNAILVGSKTILSDNPKLTTRAVPGENPLRIILVGSGKLPASLEILNDELPLLIVAPNTYTYTLNKTKQVIYYQDDRIDILKLLHVLYTDFDIGFLMVEGGSNILQQFIDLGLWDEIYRIKSRVVLDSGVPAPKLKALPRKQFQLSEDEIDFFKWL